MKIKLYLIWFPSYKFALLLIEEYLFTFQKLKMNKDKINVKPLIKKEKKKAPIGDINSIFGALKKKPISKNSLPISNNSIDSKSSKISTKKNSEKKQRKSVSNSEIKPSGLTEEGFKIYKEKDLKIGKGGNTKDCPFDCECCF